jgi:hypothetical protein
MRCAKSKGTHLEGTQGEIFAFPILTDVSTAQRTDSAPVNGRDLYAEGLEEVSGLSESGICTEMGCDLLHLLPKDGRRAAK